MKESSEQDAAAERKEHEIINNINPLMLVQYPIRPSWLIS